MLAKQIHGVFNKPCVQTREEAEAWVHGPDILSELCLTEILYYEFDGIFISSAHPSALSSTTLYSEPSWCSQDQRITLDHHLYQFIVSGFLIQSVPEEKSFSSHDFVWDHMSRVCVCAPVGFQQFVCICGVCVCVLLCWRCPHLCICVGWTWDGWAKRREGTLPEKCSLLCI